MLDGIISSNKDEASGFISHNASKSAAICILMLFGSLKILFMLFKSSLTDDHPSSDSILFCKTVKNFCCLSVLQAKWLLSLTN